MRAFDDYTKTHPVTVDVVYAKADHPENIFKTALYRPTAKIWGHKDMVALTLRAAELCQQRHQWILDIRDCLRPIEAQGAMQDTKIVQDNPHWMEEPRLLSPPGAGGHPRGMAVDIVPVDKDGQTVEMGTCFDYLSEDRTHNPAARDYTQFSEDETYNAMILQNRQNLTQAMQDAAAEHGFEILPLPQEWWDFRFPRDYTAGFQPISDQDLPEDMRVVL